MIASYLNQCWVSVGGVLTLMGKNHWFWFWVLQTGSKSGLIFRTRTRTRTRICLFVCFFLKNQTPNHIPGSTYVWNWNQNTMQFQKNNRDSTWQLKPAVNQQFWSWLVKDLNQDWFSELEPDFIFLKNWAWNWIPDSIWGTGMFHTSIEVWNWNTRGSSS